MADIPANTTSKVGLEGYSDSLSFSGQLEKPGDHDWLRVDLIANTTYDFYLSFLNTGSLTIGDSTLRLLDATGGLAAPNSTNDDSGVGLPNSFLHFTIATTGTYFIDIGEYSDNDTGTYSLYVTELLAPTILLTNDNDDVGYAMDGRRVVGGMGADRIQLGSDASDALGEQGNDILFGGEAVNHLSGGLGNDHIEGRGGDDVLLGDAGSDDMFGGNDSDGLFGGAGDDNLNGDAGMDALYGGAGKDFLTGGTGPDTFAFLSLADSKRGASRDVITDFSSAEGDLYTSPPSTPIPTKAATRPSGSLEATPSTTRRASCTTSMTQRMT